TDLIRNGRLEHEGNSPLPIRVVGQTGTNPTPRDHAHNLPLPWSGTHGWQRSAADITGAQRAMVGYLVASDLARAQNFPNNARHQYRFSNGVPNQLTMSANGFLTVNLATPSAIYAQDQSTFGRLTLQGGVRFDYASSSYPDQQLGPDKFIPVAITFPATSG